MKKIIARLFVVSVVLVLAVSAVLVARRLDVRPRTDDAFVEADIVHLAPDVSGRIVSLAVRNNPSMPKTCCSSSTRSPMN